MLEAEDLLDEMEAFAESTGRGKDGRYIAEAIGIWVGGVGLGFEEIVCLYVEIGYGSWKALKWKSVW